MNIKSPRKEFINYLLEKDVELEIAVREWDRLRSSARYKIKTGKISTTKSISQVAFDLFATKGKDFEDLGVEYYDSYEYFDRTGDEVLDRFRNFRMKYQNTSISIYFDLYEQGKISKEELFERVKEFKNNNKSYQTEGSP